MKITHEQAKRLLKEMYVGIAYQGSALLKEIGLDSTGFNIDHKSLLEEYFDDIKPLVERNEPMKPIKLQYWDEEKTRINKGVCKICDYEVWLADGKNDESRHAILHLPRLDHGARI
jgi:hypothetical protein